MNRLSITQIKSSIGSTQSQRDTLRSLGLKRISHTVTLDERPEFVGMLKKVSHLVSVERG